MRNIAFAHPKIPPHPEPSWSGHAPVSFTIHTTQRRIRASIDAIWSSCDAATRGKHAGTGSEEERPDAKRDYI